MLSLCLVLLSLVPRQTRNRTANRASHTVLDTLAEICELTLGLLSLAFLVLVGALLLQRLRANKAADELLAGTNGLIPGAC